MNYEGYEGYEGYDGSGLNLKIWNWSGIDNELIDFAITAKKEVFYNKKWINEYWFKN